MATVEEIFWKKLHEARPVILGWARDTAIDVLGGSTAASTGGGGGVTDHGALTGLADDDHSQYVHLSAQRTIAAQHVFSPAVPGAPFILDVSAQGQLVTGLNSDLFDGYDSVAFPRKAENAVISGNWTFPTTGFNIGSVGLAATTPDRLDLANGDNFRLVGGQLQFGSDVSIERDQANHLVSTAGIGSDNYASQTTGWNITYPGAADFRYLFTDELHARAFIADLEQALAGLQMIAKSVAPLAADFTAPAAGGTASLVVESFAGFETFRVFENGDMVMVREFNRSGNSLSITNCYGTVVWVSTDTVNKTQTYSFTRSVAPNAGAMTAGTVVGAGTLAIDFGTSGNGYMEQNAIDGQMAQNSPYIQAVTWTGHPHSGKAVKARLGNLAGITDANLNPFGFGLYSDNVFLNGILRAADGAVLLDGEGLTVQAGDQEFNQVKFREDNTGEVVGILYGTYVSATGDSITRLESDRITGGDLAALQLAAKYDSIEQAVFTVEQNATAGLFRFSSAGTLLELTESALTTYKSILASAGGLNIGSPGTPFSDLYVGTIHAGTVEGTTMSGQTWQGAGGNMTIDVNDPAGHRTVFVANSNPTYGADLDIERNLAVHGDIAVDGTVDGVDLASFFSSYQAHAADTADPHGSSMSVSGTLTAGSLNVTNNITVGGTVDGVDLSAFYALQFLTLAAGASAPNERILTAGNGLTGTDGGAGGAYTLAVGAGAGLIANADDIAVGAGTGITVGADDVSVNQGYAFSWTGAHTHTALATFNAGATIAAGQNLNFGADVALSRKSADILQLSTGDAFQSPSYSSGLNGWNISADGNAEFNNVRVRGELSAAVFKVNEISATAGTFGVWKSASTIYETFTSPASVGLSFTLKARNSDIGLSLFSAGSILHAKMWTGSGIRVLWATVTAVGANNGDHTVYTCTLETGSTLDRAFVAGAAVVDFGPSGTGFITLSADGAIGASANLSIATHAGSPWSAQALRARMGNLNGSYGAAADRYGLGVGDYSSGNYLSYNAEAADKFILKAGSGAVTISEAGISINTAPSDAYSQPNALSFLNSGALASSIYAYRSAGAETNLKLEVKTPSSAEGAEIKFYAQRGASSSISLTLEDTSARRRAYVDAGFSVGDLSPNIPGIGELYVGGDIQTQGGLYVGQVGQNPAAGEIVADGNINAGGSIIATGDIYTVDWEQYALGTVSGWLSLSTNLIFYKKVGKLVFVTFFLDGTSNSTSTSFTLPFTHASGVGLNQIVRVRDNGTAQAGYLNLGPGSSTVNVFPTLGGGNWTAGGNKQVTGQFWYESN